MGRRGIVIVLLVAQFAVATFGLVWRYAVNDGYGAMPSAWQMYSGRP